MTDQAEAAAENLETPAVDTALAGRSVEELRGLGIFPAKPIGNANGHGGRRPPRHKSDREFRTEHQRVWLRVPKSRYKRIVEKVVQAAERGEPWAVILLRDMTAGKPTQAIEHKSEDGVLPIVAFIPEGVTVEGEAKELPPVNGPEH
jgi:vacuolar-type H+-ATPase subunit F/Vma7